MHLKDCDDCDLCMLIFWTLSIVLVFKTRRFGDWICLHPQVNKIRGGGFYSVGSIIGSDYD
jgi:hypothetical protein